MSFNIGDWVFCEFELQLIQKTEEGRVNQVTDGVCSHGSYDLSDRCVHVTLETKKISDVFAWHSKRIHDEGSKGLNYPDIHRWLVEHWVKACSHVEDQGALAADFVLLNEFSTAMLEEPATDYGFPLMRPR